MYQPRIQWESLKKKDIKALKARIRTFFQDHDHQDQILKELYRMVIPDWDKVKEIRGRGLWVGIEFHPSAGVARDYCKRLMNEGMLCKDTHEQTMRLAPPLCITRDEIDWALERLRRVLS